MLLFSNEMPFFNIFTFLAVTPAAAASQPALYQFNFNDLLIIGNSSTEAKAIAAATIKTETVLGKLWKVWQVLMP